MTVLWLSFYSALIFSLSITATAAEPIQTISVTLSLAARLPLTELAEDVLNPSSAHFSRPYTPEEIRQMAAPLEPDYQNLLAGLRANGIEILRESPTHLWVKAKAEARVFESLFNTRIQIQSAHQHTQLKPVQIPYHLGLIRSISGLDTSRQSSPRKLESRRDQSQGLNSGILPETIKQAYGFQPLYEGGINGYGQHIAIATYSGYRIENVRAYYRMADLHPWPHIDTVEFNGKAKYDWAAAEETELDAEMAGMIAPGANIHVYTSARNDDAGELELFTAILDDNQSKIINYSWGDCEARVSDQHRADMESVFARAVAQGVNIFVASGDNGSDSCKRNRAEADWPAGNPHLIVVGGTSFSYSRGQLNEKAWNMSGGGISSLWQKPFWQSGLAQFTMRTYPDVAFNADPETGQAIFTGKPGAEKWKAMGGTSMAAPQWAAFLGLVNQARSQLNKSPLGFLNPYLYELRRSTRQNMFNDVTRGSNGKFKAEEGWDAVTGYGSMRAKALLDYLKNI